MRLPAHVSFAAVLLALAGCAHEQKAPPPLGEVVWPAPPEPPRVRLAAIVPDPAAPPPRRSFWRAALDFIVGIDRRAEEMETFVRPFGIAPAEDGAFLVADPDGRRVLHVDPQGHAAQLDCRRKPWVAPMAVARGPDGAVWVADAAAAVVVRWTRQGCTAFGAGALERPTSLAVTAERVYVVDTPRHEVVVLSHSGSVVARWGGRGEEEGKLSYPTGVAVAPDGTVLVVDALNFRIARFSPDGRWAGSFGSRGDTGDQLARPKAVATDELGSIYVSDAQRNEVLAFGPDGKLDFAIGGDGESAGRFLLPAGVGVAGRRLYVADTYNHRVQVFDIIGGSELGGSE